MQFEYFNARLLQNTALKIKQTVGAVTPPDGYAFGVLSALTNLEITNSDLVENVNSVYINTLDIKIPTEETMVEYVEYVFEHDAAKRDSVIIKSNTIPTASDELVGYEYQYMGETNNTYTHGFVYECKEIPTDTLVFTPDTVSCDWADLSAFLQTETADYNSVVAGSMTYFADAELWRATFTDANGDTVLTYQQYTGDWENVGFVFSGTFQDGDVVSFVRYTESDYVWERIDLQPGGAAQVVDVKVNGTSVVTNKVANINLATVATSGSYNDLSNKPTIPTVGNGTITITQGGTTKGTFTTNQGNNTTIDIDAGGGAGHNVGDMFSTTRNDNELNGAVECDGPTYNTTDFTGAQSIGALLEAGKIDYVSLSAYSTAISTKGWCDKIGWDGTGNTQFRVPTLNAYIWQKLQTGVAGTGTLKFQNGSYLDSHDESLGSAAGWVRTHNSGGAWASVGALSVSSDPSKSNLVAGTSTDISQQRVMIQLAVAASDEALETCTSVLADIATLKSNSVALPDYSAGVSVANITPSTPYTAPADGFLYGDIYNCTVYVNGAQVGYADDPSYSYTMMIVLSQGDIVTVNQQRFGRANFYPCKR